MQRRLFALVVFLVAHFLGVACTQAKAKEATRQPKKWTVMIYINGKNDLEAPALENFRNIASVGSSPDVDIVVALGRLRDHADCDLCKRYPWSGVRYFHVRPQMDPAPGEALRYLKDGDMGIPETLAEFVQFAQRRFPAKHFALIIWGHGYGFSFLNAMPIRSPGANVAMVRNCNANVLVDFTGCDNANEPIGGMKAVSNDVQTGHVLFNRQIEELLKQLLRNGTKLDLLGFDACLMASVETAYAMRDVADYLVASEDLVPDCSWNYAESLGPLVASKGSFGAKELAVAFVEGYRKRFMKGPKYTTLSAIDLSRVEELGTRISALAVTLTGASDTVIQAVRNARNGCRVFGRDDGFRNPVDIEQFLHNLQASGISDLNVLQATSGVLGILDSREFILDNFPTTDDAFGLTIYFPADVRFYTVNPDTLDNGAYDRAKCENPTQNNAVEFVCNKAWSVFLPAYYDRLKFIGPSVGK